MAAMRRRSIGKAMHHAFQRLTSVTTFSAENDEETSSSVYNYPNLILRAANETNSEHSPLNFDSREVVGLERPRNSISRRRK